MMTTGIWIIAGYLSWLILGSIAFTIIDNKVNGDLYQWYRDARKSMPVLLGELCQIIVLTLWPVVLYLAIKRGAFK